VTTVLVLDANQRSALAAVRSLGRAGLKVFAADSTGATLAGASRHCQRRLSYPSPYNAPLAFVDAVVDAVRAHGIDVVLPMTEVSLQLLLEARERIVATLPAPSLAAFEALSDKYRLFQSAQALGIPMPRTVFIDNARAFAAQPEAWDYPVVVKPHRSRIWHRGAWLATSVRYAHSRAELDAMVAADPALSGYPFLLQSFIDGRGEGLFALFDRGRAVDFFAHRRLRERPASGGVSVLSESAPVPADLRDIAERLLGAQAWHGVAMVEFKRGRDGVPYLMEVNARFWGSLQLAIDAGVDFPLRLVRLARGERLSAQAPYRAGARLRWLLGDLDRLYLLLKDRRLGTGAKFAAVRDFAVPTGARHEVNRFGDLRPAWFELRRYLKRD